MAWGEIGIGPIAYDEPEKPKYTITITSPQEFTPTPEMEAYALERQRVEAWLFSNEDSQRRLHLLKALVEAPEHIILITDELMMSHDKIEKYVSDINNSQLDGGRVLRIMYTQRDEKRNGILVRAQIIDPPPPRVTFTGNNANGSGATTYIRMGGVGQDVNDILRQWFGSYRPGMEDKDS